MQYYITFSGAHTVRTESNDICWSLFARMYVPVFERICVCVFALHEYDWHWLISFSQSRKISSERNVYRCVYTIHACCVGFGGVVSCLYCIERKKSRTRDALSLTVYTRFTATAIIPIVRLFLLSVVVSKTRHRIRTIDPLVCGEKKSMNFASTSDFFRS